jgi:putative acetyltransferase
VTTSARRLELDDVTRAPVLEMLAGHLVDMAATSPPESVHALDVEGLRHVDVTFWTAWEADPLVGCGALKRLDDAHGEIKTMRTAPAARGRGVAAFVLRHLLAEAAARGWRRVSLETGSQDFFAPARRLYARHGFVVTGPFGDYVLDPHSVFMTRSLP